MGNLNHSPRPECSTEEKEKIRSNFGRFPAFSISPTVGYVNLADFAQVRGELGLDEGDLS